MSKRKTLKISGKPTSSPGSEAGPLPSSSPSGQMTAPPGPAPVPANPSASRAKLEAWATSGTYGPLFIGSSPSAVLQSSLENKLRARMDVNGSLEYVLTWKSWDMPSGPPTCALRASQRRTKDKGSTGWPTPRATDGSNGGPNQAGGALSHDAALSGWQTPKTPTGGGQAERTTRGGGLRKLEDQIVGLAGWPTPMAWTPATEEYNEAGNTDSSRKTVELVGWVSPTAQDGSRGGLPPRAQDTGVPLTQQVPGLIPESSSAETASPAGFLLNPRFSLWLQGYPVEWASCGERAAASCRKSRRRL